MRRRPDPLPPDFVPVQGQRFRRGRGRPYVPDVVEQVRVLVEGTTLPQAAIAARTGLGVATIHAWIHRRRWTRPADASLSTRAVGVERAGFTRRLREALRRVEALAGREAERLASEIEPDGGAIGQANALADAARAAAGQSANPGQRRRRARPD
jgi:transposase